MPSLIVCPRCGWAMKYNLTDGRPVRCSSCGSEVTPSTETDSISGTEQQAKPVRSQAGPAASGADTTGNDRTVLFVGLFAVASVATVAMGVLYQMHLAATQPQTPAAALGTETESRVDQAERKAVQAAVPAASAPGADAEKALIADAIAERERQRKMNEEAARHEMQARAYAKQAAEQIMQQIGGGQDLICDVISWKHNTIDNTLEVECEVRFNGSLKRSNSYAVDGRLTINADGSEPRFSRTYANQRYLDRENQLTLIAGAAAAVIALDNMTQP